MPKSQKQKKVKTAEFSKPKLRLGKAKQPASNATNTSYSTKPITLPNQNLRASSTSIPTTKSNLTLNDLILRLSHYSPNTRRDALAGLRELLELHPTVWPPNLGTILHSCAYLISDQNPAVRKSLRAFFSWFLPRLDQSLFKPFSPIILFYTTSALAHIFVDIRVDAIHIIDILLELAPDCLLTGWPLDDRSTCPLDGPSTQSSNQPSQQSATRLLQLYLSLLSIGPDSTAPGLSSSSANQLSAESKLIVLKSLARFISLATAPDRQSSSKTSMPLWIFRRAFQQPRDFDAFRALLTPLDAGSNPEPFIPSLTANNFDDSTFRSSHLFERFTEAFLDSMVSSGKITNSTSHLRAEPSEAIKNQALNANTTPKTSLELLRALHPVILSIFSETAPSAFQSDLGSTFRSISTPSSGTSISSDLELIKCIVTALHRLWQASIAANLPVESKDINSLEMILVKMSTYFVFGGDDLIPPGPELNHLLQSLNLMYCDLTSLLVLIKPNWGNTVAVQLNRVGVYITDLLAEKEINVKLNTRPMTPETYRGIFPIVWSLLRHGLLQRENPDLIGSDWASRVLEALIQHLDGANPNSEVKYLGVNFLARLCILDDLPTCQFTSGFDILSDRVQDLLRKWMLGLPKLLWQLGHKTPETSHLILSFLHRVVSGPMVFFETSLEELSSLLVPFFSIVHPRTGKTMKGAYSSLPSSSQNLARGIAWYLIHHQPIHHSVSLKIALQST